MRTREEAIDAMKSVIHHFRHSMEEAKSAAGPDGTVGFGILAVHKDGSGVLISRFDAPEFFEDLALIIGAPPSTAEDKMDAIATQFMDLHGLTVEHQS